MLADGIDAAASPVLAQGGTPGLSPDSQVLDYIFHDGAHWVLWVDPSVDGHLGTTFPPPANHTLNMTRVSADGTSVTDYEIDTNYAWSFGYGSVHNPGLFDVWPVCGKAAPVWSRKVFFTRWDKPVYQATLASDGTNLWVAVVTAESVDYPWIDNKDAHGTNPGGLAQATPLATLTSGFTVFGTNTATGYLRYWTSTTGPLNIFKNTAFPLTDAGLLGMGVWNPPVVVMFAWDGSGFTRIGAIDALYCPSVIGQTDGYGNTGGSIIGGLNAAQRGPRGGLWSRVALAASPVDPGVCHAVWSEGGDWGRVADGTPCVTGPYGGSRYVWDAGAPNRDYRVNYTTWDAAGKTSDTDLASSHVDRTAWYFPNDNDTSNVYRTGYTWPAPADFAGLLCFDLRNDNAAGTPLLFLTVPQSLNAWDGSHPFGNFGPPPPPIDAHGNPWLDYNLVYGDTLYVYEITGGTMTLRQSIDPPLLPDETEVETAYPPAGFPPPNYTTPFASDCLYCAPDLFGGGSKPAVTFGPQDKAFGISLVYDDPLDGGDPVYLVHVPWARRFTGTPDFVNTVTGAFTMRGFYRVPADMSGAFDVMDGNRLYGFSILKDPLSPSSDSPLFGSADFFSDPDNVWVPAPAVGRPGPWYDRVCTKGWDTLDAAALPFTPGFVPPSVCPGFYYDSGADTIAYVAAGDAGNLFEIVVLQVCRDCRCGGGLYVWTRF